MLLRAFLRTSWKSLLIIASTTFFLYWVVRLIVPMNSLGEIFELLGGGTATLTGILSAWGWVDKYLVRRNELIRQIRNQVPHEAKSAISQLNAEGYLSDGSLKGVNLRGAKLAGVDLKATNSKDQTVAANLEMVNLKQADLSGADLRSINLKGANLEITNFSNACLADANLHEAKLTLTILTGTNLKGVNLTGATFAGEICDENTILPNGNYWSEEIDWSDFGAIEELPKYARIKSAKTPTPKNDFLHYENLDQRKHDVKILTQLWRKMNSRNITCLSQSIESSRLLKEFYGENFSRYLYERDNYSEFKFISPTLEAEFQLYDNALREFHFQLVQSSGWEDFDGTQVIQPDYKQERIKDDVRIYKEREWNKTIDKVIELRQIHYGLIYFIKRHFPEFEFFEDTSTESESMS